MNINPLFGNSDDPGSAYDQAVFLFDTKKFTDAAEVFARLVEEQPHLHEVQLYAARSYYHSAQLGRAEDRLRQIVERWPDDAYAHFMLARTLQRAGRADEGRHHLLLAEAMGYTDE